jgi:hypothetical protein
MVKHKQISLFDKTYVNILTNMLPIFLEWGFLELLKYYFFKVSSWESHLMRMLRK